MEQKHVAVAAGIRAVDEQMETKAFDLTLPLFKTQQCRHCSESSFQMMQPEPFNRQWPCRLVLKT